MKTAASKSRQQRGEIPVSQLLMIALIVLPILFLLFQFRDKVVEMFTGDVEEVLEEQEGERPSLN